LRFGSALAILLGAAPALAEPATLLRGEASAAFDGASARLTLARGRPDVFVGVDLEPSAKLDHLGAYLGARLGTTHVDIRTGAFGAYSIRRSFLPLRSSYGREEAEVRVRGEHAAYLGVSTAMDLRLDALGGHLATTTRADHVLGVPEDRYVFVEHLNVIDGGSFILSQRVGQRFELGGGFVLGGAAELLWLDAREALVARLGPEARFEASDEFALEFVLLPTLVSPDRLGLIGATFSAGAWVRFW
jgi:hypothetical protein